VPKIHFSSPRLEPPIGQPGANGQSAAGRRANPRQHGDWIDSADFIAFMTMMADIRFDVMLEAKQKDLALLRLREEIACAGLQARVW
jgi:UV DNA damage endonuclease